jgi:hypothetical protein
VKFWRRLTNILLVLLVICLLPMIALLSMAFVPLALRSAREIDQTQN